MLQAVDSDMLDQSQGLLQGWPLTPCAAGQQFVATPAAPHDRFDGGIVFRHVGHRKVTALLFLKAHDRARDVAFVEGVMGGVQAGQTIRPGGLVLIGHVLDCRGQISLDKEVSRLRRPSIR